MPLTGWSKLTSQTASRASENACQACLSQASGDAFQACLWRAYRKLLGTLFMHAYQAFVGSPAMSVGAYQASGIKHRVPIKRLSGAAMSRDVCRSTAFVCRSTAFVCRSTAFVCRSTAFVCRSTAFVCRSCMEPRCLSVRIQNVFEGFDRTPFCRYLLGGKGTWGVERGMWPTWSRSMPGGNGGAVQRLCSLGMRYGACE